MLSTIKGTYKNGQVILDETPETDGPAEVLVTFTGNVVPRIPKNPLDIANRLAEIALLEDGWLNGEGIAPKKEDLEWLSKSFESKYDKTLRLPYLYPTIAGGIQAEWTGENYDVSLNLDFKTKKALYQLLKHDTDSTEEMAFNLTKEEDWQLLNKKLLPLLKAS